jgi:hypothetical protein
MEKYIKAIQLSSRRVGSTFLQQAINSHPDIIGIDEVFVNDIKKKYRKSGFVPFVNSDVESPGEYIEDVINRTYPDNSTIFKLMYHQIEYHIGLKNYIIENNISIIYLERKNLVKQSISQLKMGYPSNHNIVITPIDFFKTVKENDILNKYYTEYFKDKIKLKLYYEDLFGDIVDDRCYMSNNSNIAVCRFFNAKEVRLFANTKKRLSDKISDHLSNLDEIRKYFKGTEYEWMLY